MNDDAQASTNRRQFASQLAGSALAMTLGASTSARGDDPVPKAAAVIVPDHARPAIPHGVAAGDVQADSAVIWSRTDRPARMIVECADNESFQNATRFRGPAALPETDYTAKVLLRGLHPGEPVFYRVQFQDLASPKVFSPWTPGRFRAAPTHRRDLTLAWGGDTAGQGWGIDPARGGMVIHDSIRKLNPDLFLHSGDLIYADNPILPQVKLDDGTTWNNLVTPQVSKVAETLDEFRGRYRYNLLDQHLRALQAEVPLICQWDDHETLNNWYPGEILDDPRYSVKSVDLLAARAKRAMLEYIPSRFLANDPERIHRVVPYGPLAEIFVLDERSFRGPNTTNRQQAPGAETAFLGRAQLGWLKRRLLQSRSTWKIIASDMPIGLIVGDQGGTYEAVANGDHAQPRGRELEIAELLRFIHVAGIHNVIWLTADVHYAAAHEYHPSRAQFTEFSPFWEFVAGPLHAGTFGPGALDNTFGPKVVFQAIPDGMKPNRPPSDNLQFFGLIRIDGKTEALRVSFHNRIGTLLHSIDLEPAGV